VRLAPALLALLAAPARAADRAVPVVRLTEAPAGLTAGPVMGPAGLAAPVSLPPALPAAAAAPAPGVTLSAAPAGPSAPNPAPKAAAPAADSPRGEKGDNAPRGGESRESWSGRFWARLLGERGRGAYQNPVFAGNVPDPGAVRVGRSFYVSATSNRSEDKFPLLKSDNLRDWTHVGFLFPRGSRPDWAQGFFWAPEIHRVGRKWVAYYTAQEKDSGRLALGAATAERVEGPWTDLGRPMLNDPHVGLIDSHRFEDHDGRHYMYWKEDSNGLSPKERTGLFVQELSRDGLSLIGKPTRLLENDLDWEGDLIEGPWVERRGKYYYLFYSANAFFDARYAVGVARALSPTGPFEKLGRPILRSSERWIGPGHNSVVRQANWADRVRAGIARAFPNGGRARKILKPVVSLLARLGGKDWIVYHAWEAGRVGGSEIFTPTFTPPFPAGQNPRVMLIDRLRYEDGWPRVEDGTPSAAPRPL
jgi:GH43 family beta-xylosidase